MTLQELKQRLDSTGLPVAYYAFPVGSAPELPFIVYLETSTNNFAADGKVYATARNVSIELYSVSRDLESEAKIEAVIDDLFWERESGYLEDEECWETIYTIQI